MDNETVISIHVTSAYPKAQLLCIQVDVLYPILEPNICFIYREFIGINKHKNKLQIYIQELMATHIIVDNGYRKIE